MTHPSERMSETTPPIETKRGLSRMHASFQPSSLNAARCKSALDYIAQLESNLAAANERAEMAEKSAAARMMMTPPTDNTPTVLSRSAKAIASVVEAGGPEPTPFMRAAMFDDDMKPKTVGRIYREPIIAVLEKYVREDVVVWFDGKYETHSDVYRAYQTANMYFASIERVPSGEQLFYTDKPLPHADAMIAFLEAIAEVVAGEKGKVG